MKPVFRGCATAIITPFDAQGAIDYAAFERLFEHQLANNIDALVVAGTTGEASTLKDKEHIDIIRFAVKLSNGRMPIIAGTGSNETVHAVHLSQEAEQAGADALLLVTPYYNKTSQQGLIVHYKTVAEAVGLPMILYNVPGRTGMTITPDTLQQLCEVPNIVGLKDATGDLGYTVKVRSLCGDKLALYSGNDDVAIPLMSVGGLGLISVISNILPGRTRDMVWAHLNGDYEQAGREQVALKGLIDALFIETNPIPVKYAAEALGLCAGHLRLPLVEAQPATQQKMRTLMAVLCML